VTRRSVVNLVKLLLVAGLMAYVFYTIQWEDARVRMLGEERTAVAGRILGDWDAPVVRFVPDGTAPGTVESVEVGTQPDGSTVEVVAGFLTYLRNLDPWLFLLGALCYFASVSFSAVRWAWLLRVNGLPISLRDANRYTWIGVFFNNIVPGQTGGDLFKALYIAKHCAGAAGSRVPAIVSVVVDRVLGLASLALLGALVVLFQLDRFPEVAIGIWGVLAGVALLGVVAFSRRIRRIVRLDAMLRKLPPSIGHVLHKVDHAIYFYRGHKRGIAAWLVAGLGNHVVSVLSVVFIGHALGVGMPVAEYFVLIPVINIISAVPLFPNGWGVGEALFGKFFGDYGAAHITAIDPVRVMRTRGVALSLLYRVHMTLWSLLGGLFVLTDKDRVTRAEVERELALEEEEALAAGKQ
jgi:uncharacterized protein (TIRG00374 family)